MFRRSATLPPAAGDAAKTAARMDGAAAAARREDWGAALGIRLKIAHAGVARNVAAAAMWWQRATVFGDADGQARLTAHHLAGVARDLAALAWLTRARIARSQFLDQVCRAARNGTADECAERRARVPLGSLAVGS